MNTEKKIIYGALASVRFALFNFITEKLKAIEVAYNESRVGLFFYCNENLTSEEFEIFKVEFEAEFTDKFDDVITKYYGKNVQYTIDSYIIYLKSSNQLCKKGYLAYKVYEPGEFDRDDYLFPDNFNMDIIEIYGSLLRPRILFACQKILINRIEKNLREIDFDYDEKSIWLYFYYDNKITELNRSLTNAAVQEFIQFFPGHNVDFKILLSSDINKYELGHDWQGAFSRGKSKND